ncbi:MAG: type II secretion system F family protein, partial [Candidatus Omnitrophica bacterium]|nr:type II secretion system F family protein [Candidatus Omnitrophota bacterium]
MKQFRYKAKKNSGETVEGELPAATRDEAVARISDLGMLPVIVQELLPGAAVTQKKKASAESAPAARPVKIGPRDLITLYRQWGRMMRAGVPILKALALLAEQSEKPDVKAILRSIYEDVKQGHTVSEAIQKFPRVFLEFDVALIRAGESVGKLYETLAEIAGYREKQLALSSKIKSALTYPVFVFFVGVGTVYFMLAQVIPQFSQFFMDLGQELPLPTRLLIVLSAYFQSYGLPVLIALTAFFFLIKASLKLEKNRIAYHRLLLHLPIMGKLLAKAEIARLTRTMDLLLANGLSLVRALHAAYPVCTNELFRINLAACSKRVEEGGVLSDGLADSKLYPAMVTYLVRTGEESGNLHESMAEIAEWYEGEVQDSLQVITKLIEPVFILLIGLVIGAIVIALLLPVFSMSAAIS